MKLLYCRNCRDAFNIRKTTKICICAKSKARCVDNMNVIYTGNYARIVCVDNYSLMTRVQEKPKNSAKAFFDAKDGHDLIKAWIVHPGDPEYPTIKNVTETEYERLSASV